MGAVQWECVADMQSGALCKLPQPPKQKAAPATKAESCPSHQMLTACTLHEDNLTNMRSLQSRGAGLVCKTTKR